MFSGVTAFRYFANTHVKLIITFLFIKVFPVIEYVTNNSTAHNITTRKMRLDKNLVE